ncbi:MAG: hypothetical protein KAX65_14515, partial [Caldilineaceae bacterium]|nr:hypothetical protein [Caldilineaceae bacterium]
MKPAERLVTNCTNLDEFPRIIAFNSLQFVTRVYRPHHATAALAICCGGVYFLDPRHVCLSFRFDRSP